MNALRASKLFRIFAALAALAVLVSVFPTPVQAAALPTFSILSVKADDSVTILTYNFPAYTLFTVRMDVVGNAAVNGIVVTQTNTGAGGSFQETYRIPAELRGKSQVAIRLESPSTGYFAYNWFNNNTSSTIPGTGTTNNPSNPAFAPKGPYLRIVGVDANKSVTMDAFNLPTYTDFKVRVGPFYNFWKGSEIVATINTGAHSDFRFTVNLPGSTHDVSWVSVRIDSTSGGYYAYNAFKNVDASISTPVPTGGSTPVVTGACSVTASSPSSSIAKNAEFDARWTVKNTSDTKWELGQVDYKYLSGTKMHKYNNLYDLPKTVKPGESITIIVDMVAPQYSGWYSTSWGIVRGSTVLCSLPLTLHVQ